MKTAEMTGCVTIMLQAQLIQKHGKQKTPKTLGWMIAEININ